MSWRPPKNTERCTGFGLGQPFTALEKAKRTISQSLTRLQNADLIVRLVSLRCLKQKSPRISTEASKFKCNMERGTRFELATFCLEVVISRVHGIPS